MIYSNKVLKYELTNTLVMAKKKESASKGGASKQDAEKGKVLAAISYLWIVGLIVLLVEKKNKFVIFHAKQGTGLFAVSIIVLIISIIPVLGWLLGWLQILLFIVALYGLVMALMGNQTKIPVINELGEKISKFIAGLKK